MSPRTVIRRLVHRIVAHPDIPATYTARCTSCGWNPAPSPIGEAIDVLCMEHAGRSGHRQFKRTVTGLAFVLREGEAPQPTTP